MRTRFFLLIVLVPVLGTGCSGINASKSVSPLDFILPGLTCNTPSTPPAFGVTNFAPVLAGASNPVWVRGVGHSHSAERQDRAVERRLQIAPFMEVYDGSQLQLIPESIN